MDRILRLFAVLGLFLAVVYTAVIRFGPRPLGIIDGRSLAYFALARPALGQTALFLVFGVGIAALTVAWLRGQYAWASILLLAVLLVTYGFLVANALFSQFAFWYINLPPFLTFFNLTFYSEPFAFPVVLALIALAYSFWPRRSAEPDTARSAPSSRLGRARVVLAPVAGLSVLLALVLGIMFQFADSTTAQDFALQWQGAFGLTSYMLAFGVGVAGLTVAAWRGQRGWASTFLVGLVLVAYGGVVSTYFLIAFPALDVLRPVAFLARHAHWMLLAAGAVLPGYDVIPAFLSVLALAYVLWPRQPRPVESGEGTPVSAPSADHAMTTA